MNITKDIIKKSKSIFIYLVALVSHTATLLLYEK